MGGGKTWLFPCADWLDPAKGAASLQRVLSCEGGAGPVEALVAYGVAVTTSDLRGAGTDANVMLQIFGDKDHTGAAPGGFVARLVGSTWG